MSRAERVASACGDFKPARSLDLVTPENLGVRNDNQPGCFAKKSAGKRSDVSRRTRDERQGRNGIRLLLLDGRLWTRAHFLPDFLESLPFAVVVAEDMDGMVLAQPAVELAKKFTALQLGDLRFGHAVGQRPKRLKTRKQCRFAFAQFKPGQPPAAMSARKASQGTKNGSPAGTCLAYSSARTASCSGSHRRKIVSRGR